MDYADNFYYLVDGEYTLLTELVIPESVTVIGSNQFSGFACITNVVFHSNVTTIKGYDYLHHNST